MEPTTFNTVATGKATPLYSFMEIINFHFVCGLENAIIILETLHMHPVKLDGLVNHLSKIIIYAHVVNITKQLTLFTFFISPGTVSVNLYPVNCT